jgi:putative ABC transport system ATP-binding protein/lipoprotein-releasing system ATP-binding protein
VISSNKILVEVEDLSYCIDNQLILDRLSFSLKSGETLAIVGQSGSGKSTILNCLMGLVRPSSGSIKIEGRPLKSGLSREAVKQRRQYLGVVFQDGHLVPELTPVENIAIAGVIAGQSRSYAYEIATARLSALGLHVGERPTSTFSGGEQQRIAIGRALQNNPKILLADEPTGNLDPVNRDIVAQTLLSRAKVDGCGVIIVTHDPILAEMVDTIFELPPRRNSVKR